MQHAPDSSDSLGKFKGVHMNKLGMGGGTFPWTLSGQPTISETHFHPSLMQVEATEHSAAMETQRARKPDLVLSFAEFAIQNCNLSDFAVLALREVCRLSVP